MPSRTYVVNRANGYSAPRRKARRSQSSIHLIYRLPVAILGLYVVASGVAFVAYGADKSAAVRNQWRTQESTLHLFGLLGGWPGALAAQRMFRHKSSKTSFQTTYWITVALNCGGLGWLLSPAGARTLQSVLDAV